MKHYGKYADNGTDKKMALIMDEEKKRKEARIKKREQLLDLALVMDMAEGRRVLSRLLKDLGLGRPIAAEELPRLNFALLFLESLKQASPANAQKILNQVYELE